MPSKTASKSAGDSGNFVDDYLADWDQDDLFGSPSPEPGKKDKQKEPEKKKDVLGVDDELNLKRKPRVPRVKLDEARLLSEKGIPKLRKMGPRIKFKGKGHEFDDAARLLSFYQAWLDDLYPKATFLDALAMVEKTGHKTTMRNARLKWIDEGKPKAADADNDIFDEDNRINTRPAGAQQAERVAPVFEKAAAAGQQRAKTPAREDLFGDDDIYNATPLRPTAGTSGAPRSADNDVPDDEDLDALMAEAEAQTSSFAASKPSQTAPSRSIFGGGPGGPPDDDDDLEALIREAEGDAAPRQPTRPAASSSIFGDGKPREPATAAAQDEGDDLDALMAEAEAEGQSSAKPVTDKKIVSSGGQKEGQGAVIDDGDDLDALMAEAEAAAGPPSNSANSGPSGGTGGGNQTYDYEDDEEVLAEMEGLW
ncbi:hypothetical protein VTJ49DRAFT_7661 [Mycothermus thermophilus]|uniref:Chromosome segregation in meiosis protein n=1 Tax=Humicola insolens TaxID=85995 RepID=A0ABR3VG91_HUMIN